MPEPSVPLTDQQIRTLFESQIQQTIRIALDLGVYEKALLNKGLLTEADIAQAKSEVTKESKDLVVNLESAIRRGPLGGIQ